MENIERSLEDEYDKLDEELSVSRTMVELEGKPGKENLLETEDDDGNEKKMLREEELELEEELEEGFIDDAPELKDEFPDEELELEEELELFEEMLADDCEEAEQGEQSFLHSVSNSSQYSLAST